MFGDDEGDVVALFVGAEALDFANDGSEGGLGRAFAMALEGFDQALFAELFIIRVVGFGYAIGVEGEGIAWANLAFSNLAIPFFENAQNGGSGMETFHSAIAAEEKAREMAAIRVTQVACVVVIFGEEESGERTVGRIVAKELVHGAHQSLRLIESDGAQAAKVGLEIGHQESGGNSFSGDVADHESKPLLAEIEEIVIIAADFAG